MNNPTYEFKSHVESAIDSQINMLILKSSAFLLIFTFIITLFMIGISYFGLAKNVLLPTSAAIFCFVYTVLLYFLSRNNLVKGNGKTYIILPLTLFPFIMFIISHYTTEFGTATFLNAPIVFVYFIILIFTGLLFEVKLTVFLGLVYSAEFYLSYILGRQGIEHITVPDSLMQQTLTSPHIYIIKAIVILLGAVLVGLIALNSKRLMVNIIVKEKERKTMDRIFGQYVSHPIKNKIIEGISETKGQRKEAAILISDLRSFTSYVENNSVEVVISQLNEYFSRMINCIERNQGVVHDFVGDGIMSVYGGLIDTDNPCDKALKACLEMNEELKIMNEKWTKAGMESFKIGVGLHYGEVTLGAIGSETRKEFVVIGDTVNTASKMESLTKDLKHIAVCSNKFYDQLTIKYKRHCRLIGDVEIKGKKNPVIIYACYNK